ncbi:MAG: CcmD family protein [Ignavibacteriales bacterium]|nr:CcmD family protein [Ignavibacteriales bacterium]MCF8315623.1 CcmD family protein [Ignavibacteriales bacterium]MCF8437183.1 CcmD family protein [Ignavibacteriales bacterium]
MEGFYSFLEKNSIYIVLFIVLVIWTGIFLFVNSTDKRLKGIENELKGQK